MMERCFLLFRLASRWNCRRRQAARNWIFVVLAFGVSSVVANAGTELIDPTPPGNQASKSFEYRGFHVDLSEIDRSQDVSSLEGMVRQQIDIVERSGLPPTTLAFFRHFPIKANADRSADVGHYSGSESVSLGAVAHADARPILLHEYMHLFHHRMMSMGEENTDVIAYYGRAKAAHIYPEGSYVLSNPKEYFATTASLFLNGWIARPPFTRENLRNKQPAYYNFLRRILLNEQ